MTNFNFTVILPPGATGGTWEARPLSAYALTGGAGVVTSFRGNISASGVLTNKDGSQATITVPGSGGYAAGDAVLTCAFTGVVAQTVLPIHFPLVETVAGVLDLAFLINAGRAQVLTPQQVVDYNALVARTTAAAVRAEAAGGLSGARAQRRAYDTRALTLRTSWYETDTHNSYTYDPAIPHTSTDLGFRDPFGGNPDAAPPPPTTDPTSL